VIVAIDPGANGGLAGRNADGSVWSCRMPATEGDLLALLRKKRNEGASVAHLENLVKFAGTNMPSSAMSVYASSWGFCKGVLMSLGFSVILVNPKEWQKKLSLGTASGLSKTEWKNKLKGEAQRVFPDQDVTLATADALLILRAYEK
jgi:hypothetical protein